MSTMTQTNNDLGAPDIETIGEDYLAGASEDAASRRKSTFVLPPAGNYILQLPMKFEVRTVPNRFNRAENCVEVLLGTNDGAASLGLTIIGGDFDGHVIKFIRVNTVNRSKFEKGVRVGDTPYNDVYDILSQFGVSPLPARTDEAGIRTAFESIAGAITAAPGWYFRWEGFAKGNKKAGRNGKEYGTTIKGAKFNERVDGKLQSYVTMTATHPCTIKVRGEEKNINPGEQYRVYANLVLAEGGAVPRK